MKKALVNVPVRVNIWIRPYCQRMQFEVLRKARPSILFLQSDGGRNKEEWEAIYQNRKIFEEEIDWDCEIHKIYEDQNLGLYAMAKKVSEYIWRHVDRCIFLEDDHIPTVSFFRYCEELLEKYKDDTRIQCICGMNHLGIYNNSSADYFFSRQGSIWGTATWKRCYQMRENTFSYANDQYSNNLIIKNSSNNKIFQKRLRGYANNLYYEGHIAGGEFYIEFAMYAHNQLQIIPKYNMICCIGATQNSSHADSLNNLPRGIRRVFNMKTYEINFPLKHPNFIIPDTNYEKKRNKIMAYNYPLIYIYRRIELIIKSIFKGTFITKIKKRREKRRKIES